MSKARGHSPADPVHRPEMACSLERALDLVANRSTWLILREIFYGTNRFLKLVEKTGLSTPVVADRLRRMTATGLVRKVAYQDPGRRARESYVFERPGLELMPALFALTQWGDRYLSDAGGPVAPVHAGCGSAIWVVPMCDDGHVVEPDEIGVALSRMFEPEVVSRPG